MQAGKFHRVNRSEEIRRYHAAYWQNNKAQLKAQGKLWRARNPDLVLQAVARRRARKLAAPGTHTRAELRARFTEQGGRCAYCDAELTGIYHTEHVIPLSCGGSDGMENIVCACPLCNWNKGSKLPSEWMERWYTNVA